MRKTETMLIVVTLILMGTAPVPAGERMANLGVKAVKARITHEQLQKQQETTAPSGEGRPVSRRDLQPVEESRERRGETSLIARSAIIASGTHWTIVPKEAVFFVPARYEARVNAKAAGRLLPWHKFLELNQNWISVQPVSIEEARGEAPIDPKIREAHRTVGKLVIAVCKGGPISVKAPVVQTTGLAESPAVK